MKPTVDNISPMKKTDLLSMRVDRELKQALDIVSRVTLHGDYKNTEYVTNLMRSDPNIRSVWRLLLDSKSAEEAEAVFRASYEAQHEAQTGV